MCTNELTNKNIVTMLMLEELLINQIVKTTNSNEDNIGILNYFKTLIIVSLIFWKKSFWSSSERSIKDSMRLFNK